jgi:hypothetical protein
MMPHYLVGLLNDAGGLGLHASYRIAALLCIAATFVVAERIFATLKTSWWIYAVLFLAPDLSFAAYLCGPRFGAMIYNSAHSYMVPMALMTAGFTMASPLVLSIAMIWLAHIGFDRALGYGLKYAQGFGFTHLGRIGKKSN